MMGYGLRRQIIPQILKCAGQATLLIFFLHITELLLDPFPLVWKLDTSKVFATALILVLSCHDPPVPFDMSYDTLLRVYKGIHTFKMGMINLPWVF